MCDSGPVKSLQRMFSFCLFCFLSELGGSGVVLATPGISKLWFLHQFSVESIGTAPLSASCVHDPGGTLCFTTVQFWKPLLSYLSSFECMGDSVVTLRFRGFFLLTTFLSMTSLHSPVPTGCSPWSSLLKVRVLGFLCHLTPSVTWFTLRKK